MKIKKSKIVVPALGLLLLSTAASVTGSVAWFTANRTFKMTAGDFAVVNTKDNLECVLLGDGVSTEEDNVNHKITVTDGHTLTDASFDHTDVNAPVIVPNEDGTKVANKVGLAAKAPVEGDALAADAVFADGVQYFTKSEEADSIAFLHSASHKYAFNRIGDGSAQADAGGTYFPLTDLGATALSNAALVRDGTAHIYSAFTWDMTFKISFSAGSTNKVGLFLDLSNPANTYVNEKFVVSGTSHTDNDPRNVYTDANLATAATGAKVTAGTYFEYVAVGGEDKAGWYTDSGCSVAAAADLEADTTYYRPGLIAGTYYKATPDDTGLGFRMAFVPVTVPTGSYGVTKVWSPNQTAAKSTHVDAADGIVLPEINAGTAYGTATTMNDGSGLEAETVGTNKVLMDNSCALGVPAADSKSSSTAKSDLNNYLGYFQPGAGSTIEITYKVFAWYEGTDENIINTSETIYETVSVGMQFGTSTLTD